MLAIRIRFSFDQSIVVVATLSLFSSRARHDGQAVGYLGPALKLISAAPVDERRTSVVHYAGGLIAH